MKFPRRSGILLHVTSLPSPHGIGDLGDGAYRFADFLSAAGQKVWQVLPLSPTGYGDSPYQCFSAFAGNHLLIGLADLVDRGLLSSEEIAGPSLSENQVDYGAVIRFKEGALRRAAERFFSAGPQSAQASFADFCRDNANWLDDYALFMAVKQVHGGVAWTSWEPAIRSREPEAVKNWSVKLAREIDTIKFCQFEFFKQWSRLKSYCHGLGINVMGDIPIYVAHDSAEVWSHPELFQLDEGGKPIVVAGVPPDYFSATGQLWGNPIYRWDLLARAGYRWWIERFKASLNLFDLVRIDHFRGFEACWEIPGDATTAAGGKWVKGPGAELFRVLQAELGELPIVAENLGVITPEVEAMRHEFCFPGMSLLQFAFGTDPQGPSFRPHNYARELVAYTGGHDNDTTVGWWASSGAGDSTRTAEDVRREHEFACAYLGFTDEPVNWVLIRAVMASVADTAIVPLQDVLGLGSEARMNLPGTTRGNWRWRCRESALTQELAEKVRKLTEMYGR